MLLIAFTEPVKPGSSSSKTLGTLTDYGAPIYTVPYTPGKDPYGAVHQVRLALSGHLPFGKPLWLQFDKNISGTAGQYLAQPQGKALNTMAAPGLLSDLGFEAGSLSGWVVYPSGLGCIKVVKSVGSLKPKQGSQMAYLSPACHTAPEALITAQLKVPAKATKLLVSMDHVCSSGLCALEDLWMTVSTESSRKDLRLDKALPKATKTVTGATTHPTLHSGFVDVALDVSAHAGSTVALTIGNLRSQKPRCGPGAMTLSQSGVLIDHIRFQ